MFYLIHIFHMFSAVSCAIDFYVRKSYAFIIYFVQVHFFVFHFLCFFQMSPTSLPHLFQPSRTPQISWQNNKSRLRNNKSRLRRKYGPRRILGKKPPKFKPLNESSNLIPKQAEALQISLRNRSAGWRNSFWGLRNWAGLSRTKKHCAFHSLIFFGVGVMSHSLLNSSLRCLNAKECKKRLVHF